VDGADDDQTPSQLDELADRADVEPLGEPDVVDKALLPRGLPATPEEKAQLFEQYKLMVQTSEALVQRRQGTNTFFLTANGVLLTALGLVLRQGADPRTHSMLVVVLALTGLITSWSWRTLLVSFGQLNKGKFAVILRLEQHLPAAIFDAEWEALGRGKERKTYRSFTMSEARVPVVFAAVYLIAIAISISIAFGWSPQA
jgi:hypothetical protein